MLPVRRVLPVHPAVPAAAVTDGRGRLVKKETLEKIFEYASVPVHGTLSRKLRKDIVCQINDGKEYSDATLFLGEEFVRITEKDKEKILNTYYDWDKIVSVRTIGTVSE